MTDGLQTHWDDHTAESCTSYRSHVIAVALVCSVCTHIDSRYTEQETLIAHRHLIFFGAVSLVNHCTIGQTAKGEMCNLNFKYENAALRRCEAAWRVPTTAETLNSDMQGLEKTSNYICPIEPPADAMET